MKEIEQIKHAIQWIENVCFLDGNIRYVPGLLRDEVKSYCLIYLRDRFRASSLYKAPVDAIDVEQISQIMRGDDFDCDELSEDLRRHLDHLGEWLLDKYKELEELHEDIMGVDR